MDMKHFCEGCRTTRLRTGLLIGTAILGFSAIGQRTQAQQFSALGTAAQFDVLTYNTPNNSDAAFNGAPIGVVAGNWNQSGGNANQSNETIYLSNGFTLTGGGPGDGATQTVIFDNSLLSSSWTDATNASAIFALRPASPGLTYGALNNTNLTITESAVGNYVVDVNGDVTFNQNHLTLSAPAGSTFLVNINGDVSLNGGSAGNGFLINGGLTANDVVYNVLGTNVMFQTTGGGNAQMIMGTILAVDAMADVALDPGGVTGELIALNEKTSSGSFVTFDAVDVPEPTTLALVGLGGLGLLLVRRRK
jgi:hypothetical protein